MVNVKFKICLIVFKDLPDRKQRSSKAVSMKKQHCMPLNEYLINLTFFRSLFRQQPHTLSSKKAVQILYKTLACKTALYFCEIHSQLEIVI